MKSTVVIEFPKYEYEIRCIRNPEVDFCNIISREPVNINDIICAEYEDGSNGFDMKVIGKKNYGNEGVTLLIDVGIKLEDSE